MGVCVCVYIYIYSPSAVVNVYHPMSQVKRLILCE